MIEVTYTLHGLTKSFKVPMDRFDELIAWATKEFTDGRDIGGPNLPLELPNAKRRTAKR